MAASHGAQNVECYPAIELHFYVHMERTIVPQKEIQERNSARIRRIVIVGVMIPWRTKEKGYEKHTTM